MTFKTTIKVISYGFQIEDISASPKKLLKFIQSQQDANEDMINLINTALNSLNLNTVQGKLALAKKYADHENFMLKFGNSEFSVGGFVGEKISERAVTIIPSEFESKVGVEFSSRDITLSNAHFYTPKVEITCSGRLYFENVDFGTADVFINGRKLTTKEVDHISSASISTCPLAMEYTAIFDSRESMSEKDYQDSILPESGAAIRSELLSTLGELNEQRQSIVDHIAKLTNLMAACSQEHNKIIDIPCSGVHEFDFMSV